jgi:activator-of-BECN1-regulated-autophagy protein 1
MVDSDLRRGSTAGSPGAGTLAHSPTQHPISAQQVIYELRVYSLEEATFGQVLSSRAVRAAHCLTSIQFSPTSGHILLAYGRRHNSLLRSLVVDGSTTIPIRVYTILEVYRVSDMELVRILPSAEDEVNVACFHPQVGGGLAYGTKEGKLRILRYDRTPVHAIATSGSEDEFFEVETMDPLSFGGTYHR